MASITPNAFDKKFSYASVKRDGSTSYSFDFVDRASFSLIIYNCNISSSLYGEYPTTQKINHQIIYKYLSDISSLLDQDMVHSSLEHIRKNDYIYVGDIVIKNYPDLHNAFVINITIIRNSTSEDNPYTNNERMLFKQELRELLLHQSKHFFNKLPDSEKEENTFETLKRMCDMWMFSNSYGCEVLG